MARNAVTPTSEIVRLAGLEEDKGIEWVLRETDLWPAITNKVREAGPLMYKATTPMDGYLYHAAYVIRPFAREIAEEIDLSSDKLKILIQNLDRDIEARCGRRGLLHKLLGSHVNSWDGDSLVELISLWNFAEFLTLDKGKDVGLSIEPDVLPGLYRGPSFSRGLGDAGRGVGQYLDVADGGKSFLSGRIGVTFTLNTSPHPSARPDQVKDDTAESVEQVVDSGKEPSALDRILDASPLLDKELVVMEYDEYVKKQEAPSVLLKGKSRDVYSRNIQSR